VNASQELARLARLQRSRTGAGEGLPDDVRAAHDRVNAEAQAATLALRTRDYASGEQHLQAAEDALKVIERFLGKS